MCIEYIFIIFLGIEKAQYDKNSHRQIIGSHDWKYLR